MLTPKEYFNQLNQDYLSIHRKKEDLFWDTYMAISDDHEGSAKAETIWTEFLANGSRIGEIKQQIESLATQEESDDKSELEFGLKGWLATFQAHALESDDAHHLKTSLIKSEAALFEKRQRYVMTYTDADGKSVDGSLTVLSANIRANDSESVRKTSHQALLGLEKWVLQNGFIELVKLRNKFARSLGFDNFFDYSIVKTEQMTTEQLFEILDDFEQRTRDKNLTSIQELVDSHGEQSVEAHNFSFTWGGDAMRHLDPYVPFSKSLRRWAESFGRLNIDYSQAELTLDLLDRKDKYQNGFCHGPVPSFYDNGTWVPAKVNFTSNAKPDQVGSGFDGINTLFHEGGHAAHFSNVKLNSPSFSQEFAPTSMAYAETQSMFCDSLLTDGDWLKAYAKDAEGNSIPDAIIRSLIESKQPFSAYGERSILVVPYFERALYAMSDEKLTAENLTALARETEFRILGLKTGPRPLLAIPHLLSNESACSYQGYLLANMAVFQTRAYFIKKFGYLTDNPEIGPLLSKHYWNPGNSINHDATVRSLTGEGFNAKYLADKCNQSIDDAWSVQLKQIKKMESRSQVPIAPLNATIKIVDGEGLIASNEESIESMCDAFEANIREQYGC